MAVTHAAGKLANEIVAKWPYRPQFDVVFTSMPPRSDLENEALYIFNDSPNFFVHNAREVVDALNGKSKDILANGELSRQSRDTLQENLGIDRSSLTPKVVSNACAGIRLA